MADRKGNPDKQPPECHMRDGEGSCTTRCPHLKESGDFECESYRCEVCGESFKLYYEDMQ